MTDTTDTPDASRPVGRQNKNNSGSARAAFQNRAFRRIWVVSFASNIGTWIQNIVLPIYIYSRTGRASLVALLIFAQLGPILLLSIPGGVLADRVNRKKFLVVMQSLQLCSSHLVAAVSAKDPTIGLLFIAQHGVGIGKALQIPAWSAILVSLVPPRDLGGAISLNSTVINGARMIGPIVVLILSRFGVTAAEFFAINAATYLFVIFALISVPIADVARDS
ncbi:MAG: MFS transporter, partial [Actinomycetota bacterium]